MFRSASAVMVTNGLTPREPGTSEPSTTYSLEYPLARPVITLPLWPQPPADFGAEGGQCASFAGAQQQFGGAEAAGAEEELPAADLAGLDDPSRVVRTVDGQDVGTVGLGADRSGPVHGLDGDVAGGERGGEQSAGPREVPEHGRNSGFRP